MFVNNLVRRWPNTHTNEANKRGNLSHFSLSRAEREHGKEHSYWFADSKTEQIERLADLILVRKGLEAVVESLVSLERTELN